MRTDEVPAGTEIAIDSTIFIYHFAGASRDCRELLERCERGEIHGLTSTVVLAEVLHRLMLMEAVWRGFVTPGNLVQKLRDKPALVKKLSLYQEQVARIPLMGIKIVSLDLRGLLLSADVRREHGLLVNDSLVATAAMQSGAQAIASADRDLRRLKAFTLYWPADIR